MKLLFIGLVMATFSTIASAEIFELRLRNFTKNNDPTCNEKLAVAASKFAEAANTEVIGSLCELERVLNNATGVISYFADEKIKVKTNNERTSIGENAGTYKTKEECLEDIEGQINYFTQATSLTPFYSYCNKRSTYDRYWTLELIAVGESLFSRRIIGTDIMGTPAQGWQEFADELITSIRARGNILNKIGITGRLGMAHLRASLYTDQGSLSFDHNAELRYSSMDECLARLDTAKSMFENQTTKPLIVFCDADTNGLWNAHINILSFTDNYYDSDSYTHKRISGEYEDLAICEADLPRIQDILSRGRNQILGVMCGYNVQSRLYQTHAFFAK